METKVHPAFLAIGAVVLLKFCLNINRAMQCRQLLRRYERYMARAARRQATNDDHYRLLQDRLAVVAILKQAGVEDASIPHVEAMGWGMVHSGHLSVLSNYGNAREDVVTLTMRAFHAAIGQYRRRAFEAFSPIFWIEAIINLPRHVVVYLGAPPDSVLSRALQLAYWAVGSFGTVLIVVYKPDFATLLHTWVDQLLDTHR